MLLYNKIKHKAKRERFAIVIARYALPVSEISTYRNMRKKNNKLWKILSA